MRSMPILRRDSGFTLLEMVVSVVLIGILAAVGSSMIADSFTTSKLVNAGKFSEDEARYVLERLAREIREIKYVDKGSYANAPGYCIDIMTETPPKFVFHKRTDANSTDRQNCTGAGTDTVTIDNSSPSSLTLTYASSPPPATLTNRVVANADGSPLLSYYQSDGTTKATTSATLYYVVIALTVTDANGQQSIAQRVRVALRNS